jgi:hypothetical protein
MPYTSYRDLCAALYRATLVEHHLDLVSGRFVFLARTRTQEVLRVGMDGITSFRWSATTARPGEGFQLSIVGLERLGPVEPWRLYVSSGPATELEVTSFRMTCDGEALAGTGRRYCDRPPEDGPRPASPA